MNTLKSTFGYTAEKRLEKVQVTSGHPEELAQLILENHQTGTRTLAVINTVRRAIDLYQAVKRLKPKADLVLLHSRFRPPDRTAALEKLIKDPAIEGSICISTQVVEAGVDISAATLITDPAPWASLVQRFGRCNRYGTDKNARVFLLNVDLTKKNAALPYTEADLALSLSALSDKSDVGPAMLPQIPMAPGYTHVLRRKDLVDLFDTTPDLSGLDIDISRFIRESEDHDCRVFWRQFEGDSPPENEPGPSRDELCTVPISDLKGQKGLPLWRWDHLQKRWEKLSNLRSIGPGMVFMLNSSSGGYCSEFGWTGQKTDIPTIMYSRGTAVEGDDDDHGVERPWQTLIQHNDQVIDELKKILSNCSIPAHICETLLEAARWHDAGKAHPVFQGAILSDPPKEVVTSIWAKSPQFAAGYSRKGFRHELASALVMLANGLSDFSVFLAAAHHGKIRLSIRSLPHERPPDDPALRFARGVWEGDILPTTNLGEGVTMPETSIDLSCMELGDGNQGASWLARMIALRDDPSLGLFRLAFCEAILRAADWRASANAGKENE